MEYYNYADREAFVKDKDILEMLSINRSFDDLLGYFMKDDFLALDGGMKIPFFAETRDYRGAREKENPDAKWIVKPVNDDQRFRTEMATVCFFVDFFTKTLSAPITLTRIDGAFYKATRLVNKAEQLSGAGYMEIRQLREQLLLDLVNRWIYCDEDRNPNNYMIKYNSANDQILIAIDFLNADLEFKGMKILGTEESFGWERMEKTRYLTPLKSENVMVYDMQFYDMRFREFGRLTSEFLKKTAEAVLRFNPDRKGLAEFLSSNILERRDYLYSYFKSKISEVQGDPVQEKYKDFGDVFGKIYNKYK